MNINRSQAKSGLKFLSWGSSPCLGEESRGITPGTYKPKGEEFIKAVPLRWKPKWHPRETSECLRHLVYQTFSMSPLRTVTSEGTPGMVRIQEHSPSLL